MKKILLAIFCFLLNFGFAQNLTVENIRERSLYLGVSNFLTFDIQGMECQDIRVNCSNGSVERDSCRMEVIPKEKGHLVLFFYTFSGTDSVFLESKNFVVKNLQNPKPALLHRSSGKLSKNVILNSKLELINIEHDKVGCGIDFPIKSFRIVATRNQEILGYTFNEGQKFTQESLDLIQLLETGDEIHFFDIIGINYYLEYVKLESIAFEVN